MKPFVPFDRFERPCGNVKALKDTMQENCNDRLAPKPEPCDSPCVPYWQPTGEKSCTESAMLEVQEADGCGNTRFTRTKYPVVWTQQEEPVVDSDTGQVTITEVNQCGQTRQITKTLPSSQVWTADTTSINLSGSGRQSNPLSAAIRMSFDAGNALEIREDGIYHPLDPISEVSMNVLERVFDGLFVGLSADADNNLEYRSDGFYYHAPSPDITVSASSFVAGIEEDDDKFFVQWGTGTVAGGGGKVVTIAIEYPVPYVAPPHVDITLTTASAVRYGDIMPGHAILNETVDGCDVRFSTRTGGSSSDNFQGSDIIGNITFRWKATGIRQIP